MAERPTRGPAVRRNGTLQSCEPCRKAKLRCDHARPVCGRCITKMITTRCFYHPAPMTKGIASNQTSPIRPSRGLVNAQPRSNASSPTLAVESTRLGANLEPTPELPGYLGATSYSAVLTEHRSDLPFEMDSNMVTDTSVKSLDPDRLRAGIELLKLLYDFPIYDVLIRKFYTRKGIIVVPITIVEAIIESIRNTFDGLDIGSDIDAQFQALVYQISQNTSRPLSPHGSMTVHEYYASFTGKNLRWEALGVVLSGSGISLMSTSDNDPDLVQAAPSSEARERLRAQIVEASSICLGFCDQASSINELLGFAQYNDVMLKTQHYGDSSYQAWRRLSDLSATVYAAGFHQESSQVEDCPFFLRQWRKICFASAFYADKAIATFVGRPPFINYRYCTLTPPMDLNEDVLVAGGEDLARSISSLNMDGWNSQKQNYRVSMIRLRFLFSVYRDQALEIALGTCDDWDLVQKSHQIIEKARATLEAAPHFIRYDVQGQDEDEESYASSFSSLHMYLDYLYTIFLLQRVLVKRTNTGQEALIDTSRQALSIVIRIGSECEPCMDLNRHFSWIILYYGVPCASVLTLELLHQTQEIGPHSVVLPRAEIIRNLSVFLSCLSWVPRPTYGNYQTCKEAEKKLSHILDQIIDPQPIQRDVFNDVTSGLDSFLDWYNPSNWDFNAEYLSSTDGFAFSRV
ncbi:hypothetical protein BDV28DRAFT_55721 [Aspergillus coremiiformis]|uniref:Zn(2)-C6 fungal-type domain-containing protein n=1 Tax=Aspergillus coremiiformis TaxID=138285 RepID=A0A5N6ZBZ8_9EURO|nr:hypothetical protein BDV28DRAFT_55721 [Aspergillus coremiiformis]